MAMANYGSENILQTGVELQTTIRLSTGLIVWKRTKVLPGSIWPWPALAAKAESGTRLKPLSKRTQIQQSLTHHGRISFR